MRFLPPAALLVATATFTILAPGAFAADAEHVGRTTITKVIASGVTLTQEFSADPPLIVTVISADLSVPGVRVETGIGGDSITHGSGNIGSGTEQVEVFAQRHAAVAAVNGDFFSEGDPLGFGVSNGEMYSEPWKVSRAALGIETDGRSIVTSVLAFSGQVTAPDGASFVLTALNRPVARNDANDLVAYSQLYGPVAGSRSGCCEVVLSGVNLPLAPNKLIVGRVASVLPDVTIPSTIPDDGIVLSAPGTGPAADFIRLHLTDGSKISLSLAVAPKADLAGAARLATVPRNDVGGLPSRAGEDWNRAAATWAGVSQAMGGGPNLVTNGQVAIDGLEEGFDASFTDRPNPRTAIGTTRDGKILLFAVDGRDALSHGATLPELADIMIRYGVVNGINLDGGGSTAMAADGLTVNYPALPGAGRRVADLLAVYARSNRQPTPMTAMIESVAPIHVGEEVKLAIEVNGKRVSNRESRVIFRGSVDGGVGFVSQDGVFHATSPGTGSVIAQVDGLRVIRQIMVLGNGPQTEPFLLTARIDAVPGDPNRSIVSARLADSTGAAGTGISVSVVIKGGTVDQQTAQTDEDGVARFTVKWADTTGSITITTGSQPPLTLNHDSQRARDDTSS